MSTPTKDTTAVTDLTYLRAGDLVEVRQPGSLLVYQGEVDLLFPQRGILWIRYGALNERKLLHAPDYHIHRWLAPPAQQNH